MAAATLSCSTHLSATAIFRCVPCGKLLCEACVARVGGGRGTLAQCMACGAMATAVVGGGPGSGAAKAPPLERLVMHDSLGARLLVTPRYLAEHSVLLVLAGLALIEAPLRWALVGMGGTTITGLVVLGLALGMEAMVYFRMVELSAHGQTEFDSPDVTDMTADILAPFGRYVVATSPILLSVVWYGEQRFDSAILGFLGMILDPAGILDYPGPMVALVLSLALWPLMTIIAAMSRSAADTLNPRLWISSLRIIGVDYLGGALAFYAVFAFELFLLSRVILWIQIHASIWGITGVVILFLGYLPMAVRARILGAMCSPHMDSWG